eukprot:CAMPEP_0113721156 /NCGR_PEP_ID=MMETSP0038_2-20120614/36944_1 /TAXON_ID=2898 /ORGANISM="Cryptomonas paramecium" /LENGTH=180 /DNA_ID=CAMNT_0000650069 /DNA_START=32 /DNA_END=572 /DNA_ORIENTATION=- /assembly_acc=CAM_ASM_000170
MAAAAVAVPIPLNKDMKFAARRVPDFAKLHALEDARLAKWKREHKKDVTVPLNVRLATPPVSVGVNSARTTRPQTAQIAPPLSYRPKSAAPSSARTSSAAGNTVDFKGSRRETNSKIESSQKENDGFHATMAHRKIGPQAQKPGNTAATPRDPLFLREQRGNTPCGPLPPLSRTARRAPT